MNFSFKDGNYGKFCENYLQSKLLKKYDDLINLNIVDKFSTLDFYSTKYKTFIECKGMRKRQLKYNNVIINKSKYIYALNQIKLGYNVFFCWVFPNKFIKYISVKQLKETYNFNFGSCRAFGRNKIDNVLFIHKSCLKDYPIIN